MPRRPLQRSDEHYYHVTARSNNRENFHLPLPEVWDIMSRKLSQLQREHEIKIAAFVLMNNHFHLMMLTPKADIDRVMYFFMKDVTLKIQQRTGRINKIFGGRYKGSLINNFNYLANAYRYIYQNPIRARIVDRAEDYPFSSVNKLGHQTLFVESVLSNEIKSELEWINRRFSNTEARCIQKALKKTVFEYPKERSTGRTIYD